MHREILVLAMHLKQKTPRFGVLLVFTFSTIALSSVGWCETTTNSFQTPPPPSTPLNDRPSQLTTKGLSRPFSSEIRRWLHLRLRPGEEEESQNLHHSEKLEDGGTPGRATGGRRGPGRRISPRMVFSTSLKNRFKRMETEGGWLFTSHSSTLGNCSRGYIEQVVPGKFYVTGQLEPNIPHLGYQTDSRSSVQARESLSRIRGQRRSGSEESWQKLQPVVECRDDAMTLTVRRRRAVQLLLDRANDSSLPLFQLPPQCGYSVETTWGDLSLMAQYDACHVIQENEDYVLPLLWRGTPVKMSCPVSQIKAPAGEPPSLCCSPYGMTVKVQTLSATEEPSINVRGEWTPLMLLAEQCGYTLDKQDTTITIAVPFVSCGITVKDGKYTLSLQMGPSIFTLACPVSTFDELLVTHQHQADSPPYLIRQGTNPVVGSLGSVQWIPPFYLAPPYYPHPTYEHGYSDSKGHDSQNPPTPLTLTPEATFSLQPVPSVSSQPSYQDQYFQRIPLGKPYESSEDSVLAYPDQKQNQEVPVSDLSEKQNADSTSSPADVNAPHSQPPSHDFSLYYHYYHHPKIPLRGTPQNPDPGVSGLLPSASLNHPFQPFPSDVQQSDSFSKTSPHETTSYPHALPTNPKFLYKVSALNAPYPPQPYPYHYFYYFPQIAKGVAKKLGLLHPDLAASTNLSCVHSPHSSVSSRHDKNNMNPHTNDPNADKSDNIKPNLSDNKSFAAAVQPPVTQSYPQRPDPAAVPPTEQPSLPTPGFLYNPNPYQYYYNPYYNQYLMYHGPESLLGADKRVSATSSKNPNPLAGTSFSSVQHLSHLKPQTTASPTKSMSDVPNELLYPYYYYLYYQPQMAKYNQEPKFVYGRMQRSARASETGYPSIPLSQYNSFHSLYPYYVTQQHPYGQHSPYFQQHSGNEAKEKLDNKMGVHHKPNPYTPVVPPCSFGPVSGVDCRNQLGCCSYSVQDGTHGPYFVFAMPNSVTEPTVVPPALHSEDSNGSCTLQKLTSDPDIYIVPLDGCGVNKHMFGPTVVHLLEVQGVQSHKGTSSANGNSPVRLMVGCSSSPHTPGEVRFHMMDQPPQPPIHPAPAAITVLLRLATDESFTRYYPEAHLPLSLLQGKPVYVELSLLGPSDPNLVLLVHSCLAYTLTPYVSWILFYDGCPSQGFSQLLPSPNIHHIRRIKITSFPRLPLESLTYVDPGGYSLLQDPEVYFLCLSESCSAADGGCREGCMKGPSTGVRSMK
ncbi:uncharacterized protein LOC121630922 [Melanotaenia boesemani]|uniref:uncharacterized protein LOC121630922 n=1 Tax=Melanotaenia boesemani TaxID=1250792 RepID=UPI001C049672|nr:uncharacterized protein LOC121630922 [Melanotaenia boesemani]